MSDVMSELPADVMEKIKGLTLMEAAALIKDIDSTFGLGPKDEKPKLKDIVDTAVAAGAFGTLAAAVGAAGLVDTLKSAGPFTVFAPTDAAFAKLPAGTVEELVKPENKAKLTGILTYHVVSGKVMASTVVNMDGQKVKTVNGAEITIKVSSDGVMVDGAKVTTTDVECSNGVIHIIDSVILPA
jgi:uncharacterized surface protein with fasciclin (FAS1) repeats